MYISAIAPCLVHLFAESMCYILLGVGGIGVCVKPQKRTKNYRKPRSASKIREDVHAVEAVEVRIFQRETGKIPNRIEWQIRKPDFIFAEKQKPRAK